MREVTSEWISKAEGDYRSAKVLLYQLESPEIDFPRNHDLVRLLVLCLNVDESFENIRDNLRRLENYGVIIRYPGLTVPLEMAHEAFDNATLVREFIRKKLKAK